MNFLKDTKIRNWGLTAIALVAVVWFAANYSSTKASDVTSANVVAVVSLEVAETIDASGSLEADPFASLRWKTAGTVEMVNVQAGDVVQADDVLITLQDSSASASLVASKADLETAQDKLDALLNPDGESVGAAREKLSDANSNWEDDRDDLMTELASSNGDSDLYNDVTDARDDLDTALNDLEDGDYILISNTDGQMYYWAARMDSLGYAGDFDFAALKVTLRAKLDSDNADLVDEVLDAQALFEKTVYDYVETIDNQDDALQVVSAVAVYERSADALLDASQSLYELLTAPSDEALASAQANVDAAQASVNLLSIVAPFDGEILSVEHKAGDVVEAGMLEVNIANRANLFVETQVDESDIANVKVGNPAEITLDALANVTLTGEVTSINPVGESDSGVIKYTVRIDIDPIGEDMFLPLGATADVIIQIKEAAAVLAVPLNAVQNDGSGEYVWLILANGTTQRVDIESHEIVGDLVVVTGDLHNGDRIQLVHENNVQGPPIGQ